MDLVPEMMVHNTGQSGGRLAGLPGTRQM